MSSDNLEHEAVWMGEGVYDIGVDEVLVKMIGQKLIAVSNICPHKMGPMSEGELSGDVIECPWHGYQFNAHTGVCENKKCHPIRTYNVAIKDSKLFLAEKKQ